MGYCVDMGRRRRPCRTVGIDAAGDGCRKSGARACADVSGAKSRPEARCRRRYEARRGSSRWRFADARNGRAWIARRCAGDENADEIDAVAVQLFARFSAFRVYRRHDLEEWRKYVHRQKRCDFDSGSPYPRGIDSLERVAARGMGKDDWISLSRNPR